jgi:hypothetical protein
VQARQPFGSQAKSGGIAGVWLDQLKYTLPGFYTQHQSRVESYFAPEAISKTMPTILAAWAESLHATPLNEMTIGPIRAPRGSSSTRSRTAGPSPGK